MKNGSGMLSGLKDRSPKAVDASQKPKGGSVNSETTRSGVANSHSLGGRVA